MKQNTKEVPYPYCLFLEYRLKAYQNSSRFTNPNNPSSDEEDSGSDDGEMRKVAEERRKFREMNVYKGYRGYKTMNQVRLKKKMKRGIAKNSDLLAKEEQFFLKSLLEVP